MRFSYVLPDPTSCNCWDEFDGDLAHMKRTGYEAVELQIADPAELDRNRLWKSLKAVGYRMCAFQTGGTYSTVGNCLCTADSSVRQRTIDLLKSFVDLAEEFGSVIVFGSLQGRSADEPGLKMMVDTFHMNIEEKSVTAQLEAMADILVHVTNGPAKAPPPLGTPQCRRDNA